MAVPVKAEATCSACGFSAAGGIYYERAGRPLYRDIPMIIFRSYLQYTQWEYEFVEMDGDINESLTALLEMLANGEIDMLGGMAYNDALAEIYDYPGTSYGEVGLVLAVDDDNSELTRSILPIVEC